MVLDLELRAASMEDLRPISVMLVQAGLPDEDVADHLDTFLVIEKGYAIVGVIGLELLKDGSVLARSLVVEERQRGQGLADLLWEGALFLARDRGAKTLWAMTYSVDDLLTRWGCKAIAREDAPEPLKVTRQFSTLCTDQARVYRLDLSE